MDTVRVVHFADLHLGVEAGGRANPGSGLNQRIHDVCDRLDELCAHVEEERVHAVLFAGDAFKNQHPTPTLQRLFAERMRRLARSGARVFLLIGNHDLPKMAALSHPFSIYDALEVDGVVVGDRAALYRLDVGDTVLQVAALPHFSRHQVLARLAERPEDPDAVIEREIDRTVRRLAGEVDPSLPAVFVGHCHVNQAVLGPGQPMFGLSDVEVSLSTLASSDAFAYYALGHVHHRQELSSEPFVAYSGSLERVDFGEGETVRVGHRIDRKDAEAKGFYRFDLVPASGRWALAAQPSFIEVEARRFVTVRLEVSPPADPTGAVLAGLARAAEAGVRTEGAFVKVAVRLPAADRSRLRHQEVRAALSDAYDVRVSCESLDEATAVRDPRFAEPMGEVEALEHYVLSREDWAADRDDLLRVGRDLIRETAR